MLVVQLQLKDVVELSRLWHAQTQVRLGLGQRRITRVAWVESEVGLSCGAINHPVIFIDDETA